MEAVIYTPSSVGEKLKDKFCKFPFVVAGRTLIVWHRLHLVAIALISVSL